MVYEVLTVGGRCIYRGADYEEAVYQRDELNYEYPEMQAQVVCFEDGQRMDEDIYGVMFGEPTLRDIMNYING
jgi:hypothetical protein